MLALKKKREAEAKAKAAAAAAGEPSAAPEPSPAPVAATKKVSLLGIGGKKKKDNGEIGKGSGKRRTPGEIRIQKGEFCRAWFFFRSFRKLLSTFVSVTYVIIFD